MLSAAAAPPAVAAKLSITAANVRAIRRMTDLPRSSSDDILPSRAPRCESGQEAKEECMSAKTVLQRMDEVVDVYCKANRYQQEDLTPGRARTFIRQHRQNTRQRNSLLKLRVATNCPDWDTRLKIIHACSQEIIADDEFAGGKPHWKILEDLGVTIGMSH